MFSKIAVTIFVVVGIALTVLSGYQMEDSDGQSVCNIFSIVAFVVAGIWLVSMSAGSYTNQLEGLTQIKTVLNKIRLYEGRRDKLINIVKTELAKYPKLERKIMGNIKPEVLLEFPTLKSNETIAKTVEEIIELENSVYELQGSLIECQQPVYYREISPWVISIPSYEKILGEPNSFVVMTKSSEKK
ncbi:MAG: hypothetical protein WCV80_01525 [Candidatus Paceibacterota bacterium]|jgi:hypothetical protein